ncbi:sialic acid-binding Ig-like lectin 14 [Maylandia zebra]|uniref:sialic acid-binding Ig-like lectin 14 n=1 Tax=Maylandia zebra TaxID=106582 RepID=UPI00403D5119
MIPTLTEGQQATLTCTAPGLCSGSVPEITWTWRGAGGTESYITGNSVDFKTENLTDATQRHISTLTFNPSAEQHNTTVTCKIHFTCETTTEEASTLKVNYMKEVEVTGVTSVREGNVLNLTCSVESFPPARIVWKKVPPNTNLQTENTDLHNDTGSATLVSPNVTAENSGQYICMAKHLDKTLTSYVNVTLTSARVKHCGSYSAVLPWIVAGVSLTLNVFCITYIWFLWTSRKKGNLHQEERTDMSLQKADVSPDYDVIAHHIN